MSTPFFDQLVAAYKAGEANSFILHLNVFDYVQPGAHLQSFLSQAFAHFDVIAHYDRASGITFPVKSMEDEAKRIWGMDAPQPQTNNPLAALMGTNIQAQQELPKAPAGAIPLLTKLLTAPERCVVIVNYAETIMPPTDISMMQPDDRNVLVTMAEWGRNPARITSDNIVILVTANLSEIHPMLRSSTSRYRALQVPMPDYDSRLNYINTWLQQKNGFKMPMSPATFAANTGGMMLTHIEDICLAARQAGSMTMELMRTMKSALVAQEFAGLLEILEPTYGFDQVGGMDELKAWANDKIIEPLQKGDHNRVIKGALFDGPPGTGKTFFIRALAAEIGYQCLQIYPENVLGSFVGQSERQFSRVLDVATSLAPTLVFIDELDQSDFAARGNSSGNPVAKNLFSRFLRWLNDTPRGKIIFIGASNRLDLVDPALMRNGRMDAIIPVLPPAEPERTQIAVATATRMGCQISDEAINLIATRSEKYSAADVAALVQKANSVAYAAGRTNITTADALHAVNALRPTTLKTTDYFTMLAIEACNDRDLLPAAYRGMLDDRSALEAKINAAKPADRSQRSF